MKDITLQIENLMKAFEEQKHPRGGKGTHEGGKFVKKNSIVHKNILPAEFQPLQEIINKQSDINTKEELIQNLKIEKTRKFALYEPPSRYVVNLSKEYDKTGKYPYLADVVNFIQNKMEINLSQNERDNLHTQVFNARGIIRAEDELKDGMKLINEGWSFVNVNIIKDAYKNKKDVVVKLRRPLPYANNTSQMDGLFKPFVDSEGEVYLMKPKSKTRGIKIGNYNLEYSNMFVKTVDKKDRNIFKDNKSDQ